MKQSKNLLENGKSTPWKPEEKKSLAIVIGQAFDMQKQFGKTTGQLENIVNGFCWIMEPYPVEIVMRAFAQYIRERSDMPTPSDLVKIIDPQPPKPIYDKSLYITLKKIFDEQGPFGLQTDEIEYIKCYEEQAIRASK